MTNHERGGSKYRDSDRAENLGLSGHDFLAKDEYPGVCCALGSIVTDELWNTFVSPTSLDTLHSEIAPRISEHHATELSIELAQIRLASIFDAPTKDLRADLRQLAKGTTATSREALVMASIVLKTSTDSLLWRARSCADEDVGSPGKLAAAEVACSVARGERAVLPTAPRRMLVEDLDPGSIRRVGVILSELLDHTFVSAKAVSALHPDIPEAMARGTARELSLHLLINRVEANGHYPRTVWHSAVTQVLGGTLSAQSSSLDAVCEALGVEPFKIIESAQQHPS
jgi:hypothetical protein